MTDPGLRDMSRKSVEADVNRKFDMMYPSIRVLLIIGCTLPVSSSEDDCSFSGLQRIKSYLRNRMSDERLSGLAPMRLHHDLDNDVDEICTIFGTKHAQEEDVPRVHSLRE